MDINFIEVDSDESRKHHEDMNACFPEKNQDVFKRALAIGERALSNIICIINKLSQSESGKP